jgi:hypothetical protein
MATASPFAYNTEGTIPGTQQVGFLSIGTPTSGFTNNPQYWNGPDEELGYVIAVPVSGNTQPTPVTTNRVYLSPTYKGTDIQLSNNNQTASQLFGYQQSVLGVNPIGTTDKVMFSVLCTLADPGAAPDSHFVGVGYTTMNYSGSPYGGFPGTDNQSMGYSSGGDIWYNGGVYQGGLETWGNNDIIDIVVDNNTNGLWVRVNGGNWNNNPSANPATGSNGIETIGGPFYPVLCPSYEGTMIIQNSPAYSVPSGYNFLATLSSVGFFQTIGFSDSEFVQLANVVSNSNYTTASEASLGLTANGFWNSYVVPNVTPTPTGTPTSTPTGTPAAATPTLTTTSTPTPSVTNTQTPSVTPTLTPTPSTSPIPVTGYSFNLIQLPYNFPATGNTIMNATSPTQTGSTNPNELTLNQRGIYFNSIDSDGVDRTSYFSQFTGQSITITMTQTGSTAIYSGDTQAFKYWSGNTGNPASPTPGSGFVFGTNIQLANMTAGTGNAVIIQSASTNWVSGQTVYISAVVNGVGVTPTPTATSVTPTPTPTSGASGNFNVSVSQVGSDVVWNGSGSFNTTSLISNGTQSLGAGFQASLAIWAIGDPTPPGPTLDIYSGVTTFPTSFGTGGPTGTPSGFGDNFGILPNGTNRNLLVPTGYTSGSFISGTTTYAGATIAGMGLSGGTYTWSWGSGGNASSIVMTITP